MVESAAAETTAGGGGVGEGKGGGGGEKAAKVLAMWASYVRQSSLIIQDSAHHRLE